jgi:hypothetical protein
MDTSNILAYRESGDPDLADIKACLLLSRVLTECMSRVPGLKRCGPTRDTDGQRRLTGGNMISSYLSGEFLTGALD